MRNVHFQFLSVAQNRRALKLSNNNMEITIPHWNRARKQRTYLMSTWHQQRIFHFLSFVLMFLLLLLFFFWYSRRNKISHVINGHSFRNFSKAKRHLARIQSQSSEKFLQEQNMRFERIFLYCLLKSVLCRRPWRGGHKHGESHQHEKKVIDRGPHWCTRRVNGAIRTRLNSNNINRDCGIEIRKEWIYIIKKHKKRSLRNNPSKQQGPVVQSPINLILG